MPSSASQVTSSLGLSQVVLVGTNQIKGFKSGPKSNAYSLAGKKLQAATGNYSHEVTELNYWWLSCNKAVGAEGQEKKPQPLCVQA